METVKDSTFLLGLAADKTRQSAIGLTFACVLLALWIGLHITTSFFWPYPWSGESLWSVPFAVAAMTWLYVAIFIVAHDCMHGTMAPRWPWLNPWIGRICLFCYSAFDFETMREAHRRHHMSPGTPNDPDYFSGAPQSFWRWYFKFLLQYFGIRQILIIASIAWIYIAFGAHYQNLLMFWFLPSILSSIQLFMFGTYLPHREEEAAFSDRHRARSTDYPWLISLITCLHFCYHHDHHSVPGVPRWRLPELKAKRRTIT